jgi:hypothetical protein
MNRFLGWTLTVLVTLTSGQPLRPLDMKPSCIQKCLEQNVDCHGCVRELTSQRYSAPRAMTLPFHKVRQRSPIKNTALSFSLSLSLSFSLSPMLERLMGGRCDHILCHLKAFCKALDRCPMQTNTPSWPHTFATPTL